MVQKTTDTSLLLRGRVAKASCISLVGTWHRGFFPKQNETREIGAGGILFELVTVHSDANCGRAIGDKKNIVATR